MSYRRFAIVYDTAMPDSSQRRYRAGDSVDDLCRACKAVRRHTVMAVAPDGAIIRVICGYCSSQHHYRGIDDLDGVSTPVGRGGPHVGAQPPEGKRPQPQAPVNAGPIPLVSERERRFTPMSLEGSADKPVDLEMMMRRVLREEMGLGPAIPAEKWRGGEMILRPGRPGLQEKTWPIETFFHKVVMLRNRLRVLEQQINGEKLSEDVKIKLQGYITGCYGTLTSFNILFAEEEDRFQGSSGGED